MMNFFEELKQTNCKTINFTVVFNDDNLTLSIIPKSSCEDDSIKELKPIILNGPVKDFSNKNIFNTIKKPLENLAQDFSNLEQYLAQKKESQKKSQIAKDLKKSYEENKKNLIKLIDQGKEKFNNNKKKINNLLELVKNYNNKCQSISKAEQLIAQCSQENLFTNK